MAELATYVMCAGTALLIVTLSDGCLQMLLAVTVHGHFDAGHDLVGRPHVTSSSRLWRRRLPGDLAVDLSRMRPGGCAKACGAYASGDGVRRPREISESP